MKKDFHSDKTLTTASAQKTLIGKKHLTSFNFQI